MTVKVSSLTSTVNRHMSDDRPQRILRPEEYQRRLEREFARRYVVMVQANRRRTLAVQNGTSASTAPLIPRMEICDAPDSPTITALFELPGIRKEEIGVHITLAGKLTISGERRRPPLLTNENPELPRYTVRELKYGRYERTLQVPEGLEVKDITANLTDGMLSVSWPRQSPSRTQASQSSGASTSAQPSNQSRYINAA